jgi:hypothetical protein
MRAIAEKSHNKELLCDLSGVPTGDRYLCCDPESVSYLYWCSLKLPYCIMGPFDFSCSLSVYVFVFMGVQVCK